jgi:hypothetical protein
MAYFKRYIMTNESRNRVGIFLAKNDTTILYVRSLDESKPEWTTGDRFDETDFAEDNTVYSVNKRKLNRIVGYVMDFKGQDMAFYYKDITLKRNNKGRRCDRSGGKIPIMDIMNELLDLPEKRYTKENMDHLFSGGLCVVLEMLLREFDHLHRNDKIYCLTPEQAIRSDITRFSV